MDSLTNSLALLGFLLSAKVASELGRERGSYGFLPTIIGFFLYYHLFGFEGEGARSILIAIILLNAGTIAGCSLLLLQRVSQRRQARLKFLPLFIISYFLSFAIEYSNGGYIRELIVNGGFILAGTMCGMLASARDLRRAIWFVLVLGVVSTVVSFSYAGKWTFDGQGLQYSPFSFGAIGQEERRVGFFPSMAFDAGLLAIAILGTFGAQAIIWKRMSPKRIAGAAALVTFLAAYMVTSQYRVFLAATAGVVVAALIPISTRQKWLLPVIGFSIVLFVLQFGVILGVLELPFITREQLGEYGVRSEINRRTYELFLVSPIIGSGFSSNGTMFQRLGLEFSLSGGELVSGSHSAHWVILTEMGIIGILFWAALWAWTLWTAYVRVLKASRAKTQQFEDWMIFLLAVAIFVAQFFHAYIYDPWLWMVMAWSGAQTAGARPASKLAGRPAAALPQRQFA